MKIFFYFLFFISQFCYGQDSTKFKKLLGQALVYEQKGDLDNAIKTHKKILEIDPGCYPSTNTIAGLYGLKQNFSEEIIWAQKTITISPTFSMGYINLGNGYAGQGNFKKAEEYYVQAAKYDSSSPFPPYSLGVLEENKGNFKAAITYYQQSVARDSTFENGYFNLAAAYANIKDFKNANINILKVLELNPKDKDAQEMHEHILLEILKR
jgi:tetratricopeptide (TPR) repeat protein